MISAKPQKYVPWPLGGMCKVELKRKQKMKKRLSRRATKETLSEILSLKNWHILTACNFLIFC